MSNGEDEPKTKKRRTEEPKDELTYPKDADPPAITDLQLLAGEAQGHRRQTHGLSIDHHKQPNLLGQHFGVISDVVEAYDGSLLVLDKHFHCIRQVDLVHGT